MILAKRALTNAFRAIWPRKRPSRERRFIPIPSRRPAGHANSLTVKVLLPPSGKSPKRSAAPETSIPSDLCSCRYSSRPTDAATVPPYPTAAAGTSETASDRQSTAQSYGISCDNASSAIKRAGSIPLRGGCSLKLYSDPERCCSSLSETSKSKVKSLSFDDAHAKLQPLRCLCACSLSRGARDRPRASRRGSRGGSRSR